MGDWYYVLWYTVRIYVSGGDYRLVFSVYCGMGIELCHEDWFCYSGCQGGDKEARKPEIINSDQGSQFTSKDYIDCIKSYESISISKDGTGRAKDNARTERFFRFYKWERLYLLYPETVPELKQMTREYIAHYNWHRPHQSLDYNTPSNIHLADWYAWQGLLNHSVAACPWTCANFLVSTGRGRGPAGGNLESDCPWYAVDADGCRKGIFYPFANWELPRTQTRSRVVGQR